MLIFLVFIYLFVVSLILWFFFAPEQRQRCINTIKLRYQQLLQYRQQRKQHRQDQRRNQPIKRQFNFSWQTHKRYFIATTAILILPVLLAVLLRSEIQVEGFSDIVDQENHIITTLLQGEQLIPPPPLPPEAFLTAEVQAERPQIQTASRNWDLLDADFQQRLLLTFKIMERDHGYQMVIIEGYRSPERQAKLAQMGGHVTNAGAYQSYHQYGLAADSAFLRDGKIVISEKDPWAMRGYQLYGEVAESVGLTWGGRWKLMDFGHVELRRKGVLGTKPPETPHQH